MADLDALAEVESLVRERMRLAMRDKAVFKRDSQRLNSQLMQGEINMGTAVLGWIERLREGADITALDEDADDEPPEP